MNPVGHGSVGQRLAVAVLGSVPKLLPTQKSAYIVLGLVARTETIYLSSNGSRKDSGH
jgi:hypothetical protein